MASLVVSGENRAARGLPHRPRCAVLWGAASATPKVQNVMRRSRGAFPRWRRAGRSPGARPLLPSSFWCLEDPERGGPRRKARVPANALDSREGRSRRPKGNQIMYGLKKDWVEEPSPRYYTLDDYEGAAARWCPGCGDHAVLGGGAAPVPRRAAAAGEDGLRLRHRLLQPLPALHEDLRLPRAARAGAPRGLRRPLAAGRT